MCLTTQAITRLVLGMQISKKEENEIHPECLELQRIAFNILVGSFLNIQQVLKQRLFIQGRFVKRLMACHGNLALVYINQPVVKMHFCMRHYTESRRTYQSG